MIFTAQGVTGSPLLPTYHEPSGQLNQERQTSAHTMLSGYIMLGKSSAASRSQDASGAAAVAGSPRLAGRIRCLCQL